jgi:hypothetical protein
VEEGEERRIVEVDGMELHLDPAADADGEVHTALPPRVESWRRRSVAGAILTGIGLGLKQVLEPQREEAAIIVQSSGEPPADLPVEADLGGIHPSANVVRIRPWLMSPASVSPPASSPRTASAPESGQDAPTPEGPGPDAP